MEHDYVLFCRDMRAILLGDLKALAQSLGFACECENIADFSFENLTKVDDSNCNIPCPSETNETCGGKTAIEYYTAVFGGTDPGKTLATTTTSASGTAVTTGVLLTNAVEEKKDSSSGSGALGTSWLIAGGSLVTALLLGIDC